MPAFYCILKPHLWSDLIFGLLLFWLNLFSQDRSGFVIVFFKLTYFLSYDKMWDVHFGMFSSIVNWLTMYIPFHFKLLQSKEKWTVQSEYRFFHKCYKANLFLWCQVLVFWQIFVALGSLLMCAVQPIGHVFLYVNITCFFSMAGCWNPQETIPNYWHRRWSPS